MKNNTSEWFLEIGFFNALAEMPNEFTSNAFNDAARKHGVSDDKIERDWGREFLKKYANQKNGRYSKTYIKKSANELAELKSGNALTLKTPKTPNLPPVYPQSLFNEKSESFKELKGYSDKELAEELKKRGFKVMVQEITYKEI